MVRQTAPEMPALLRNGRSAADPAVRFSAGRFDHSHLAYQGIFPQSALRKAGLPAQLFAMDALEFYGKINFLKGGLLFADYLSDGEPPLRERNSDAGIWRGPGRRDRAARGQAV